MAARNRTSSSSWGRSRLLGLHRRPGRRLQCRARDRSRAHPARERSPATADDSAGYLFSAKSRGCTARSWYVPSPRRRTRSHISGGHLRSLQRAHARIRARGAARTGRADERDRFPSIRGRGVTIRPQRRSRPIISTSCSKACRRSSPTRINRPASRTITRPPTRSTRSTSGTPTAMRRLRRLRSLESLSGPDLLARRQSGIEIEALMRANPGLERDMRDAAIWSQWESGRRGRR